MEYVIECAVRVSSRAEADDFRDKLTSWIRQETGLEVNQNMDGYPYAVILARLQGEEDLFNGPPN